MTMRQIVVTLAIVALGLLAGSNGARAAVAVGDALPPFNLIDLSGTSHSPAKYRGKVVVVWIVGYN